MHVEFIRKRKLDLEIELELLGELQKGVTKKPRRDLNINRPPRIVEPVPDKVWQAVTYGIRKKPTEAPARPFDPSSVAASAPNALDQLFEEPESVIGQEAAIVLLLVGHQRRNSFCFHSHT